MRTGQITEVVLLGLHTLETDAYGGSYIGREDFAAREEIEPGLWRMFDHEDDAVPASGPLYQYADAAMVSRMEELLA